MTTHISLWHQECGGCDAPFTAYAGGQLNDAIELLPGRKRLEINTDIADEAVGEIILRGPLTP